MSEYREFSGSELLTTVLGPGRIPNTQATLRAEIMETDSLSQDEERADPG